MADSRSGTENIQVEPGMPFRKKTKEANRLVALCDNDSGT